MNEETKEVKATTEVAAPAPAEKAAAPAPEAKPAAQATAPAAEAKPVEVKAEVKTEAKPVAQVEAKPAVQPASEPAPKPQVMPQPASEPVPKPQPQPQPAQAPAPAPVQTVQAAPQAAPAAEAKPAVQQATPTAEAKPAVQQAAPAAEVKPAEPVQTTATTPEAATPAVAPQAAAPTPPAGETIKEAPALNPIANNTQPAPAPVATATTADNQVATVAPSAPLETSMDTNVGFVAVSDDLHKKSHKPLIITIVLILLAGLGAVGYFVVYPYIVKTYIAKPEVVYNQVIDNAFKRLDTTVDVVAHSKVIYDVEAQIDTNIEQIKDLNGFTYAGNFGVDPEGKNLQSGIRIKDSSNQEHSAFIYVKGDRQYLRLSSYRELIYMGTTDNYKDLWDELYKRFNSIDDNDYEYLINKTADLVKDSIVKSKLTKEDASITVNDKTYKVLNHKYTIDNDTLNTMIKGVLNELAKDDKALLVLSKNLYKNVDDIKKEFNSYDSSRQLLKDDETIVINVYTYPTKAEALGIKIEYGDMVFNNYEVDDYFEYKYHSIYQNKETGKDVETNAEVIGKKENGKTNVTVTYNDKELANLVISSWDEKSIDFKYEVNLNDQKLTGSIKIDFENNDNKSKVTFNGSLNVGQDYLKVSLALTNDWTSEVANINVSTAKDDLSDAEIEMKMNEFGQTLEGTPIYKLVSTTGGDYLPPNFKQFFEKVFRVDLNKKKQPQQEEKKAEDVVIKTTTNNANNNAGNEA